MWSHCPQHEASNDAQCHLTRSTSIIVGHRVQTEEETAERREKDKRKKAANRQLCVSQTTKEEQMEYTIIMNLYFTLRTTSRAKITARHVTDGRTICRDASQFKLANAMINTTNENGTTEEANPPAAVSGRPGSRTPHNSEHERPGSRNPHIVPPNQKPANTETTNMGDPEMLLEQAKLTPQGKESDQPSASSTPIVNQSPISRPRRERHKPLHLKKYVLT